MSAYAASLPTFGVSPLAIHCANAETPFTRLLPPERPIFFPNMMTRYLAILLAPFLASTAAFSQAVEVNGIAAKVNGRVITKNEVSFMLAPVYAQLATQFPRRGPEFESQFKDARDKVLQELIDRQIILDEFKQIGASIRPN